MSSSSRGPSGDEVSMFTADDASAAPRRRPGSVPMPPPLQGMGPGAVYSPLALPGAYIQAGSRSGARKAARRTPPPISTVAPPAPAAAAQSPTAGPSSPQRRPSSPLTSLRASPPVAGPGSYFFRASPDLAQAPAAEPPASPSLASSSSSIVLSPVMAASAPSLLPDTLMMPSENFPLAPPEAPVDMYEDEALTPLEKIYIFSRSEETFHRLFILHHLPAFLEDVSPAEAVEYVLPLLPSLAVDDDDSVKEALATELSAIIWWFVNHCQLVDEMAIAEDEEVEPTPSTSTAVPPAPLFVQSFTPILGTLLLSPNGCVSGPARHTVVDLLARVRGDVDTTSSDAQLAAHRHGRAAALFGEHERRLLEDELLSQVVIGMGRLDHVPAEGDELLEPEQEPEEPAALPHPGPLHLSLTSSAAPTPSRERPLRSSPNGPMASPPLDAQPWHIALPPTPASERPWAQAGREPWTIALPPTPAGEHPWAPGVPAHHQRTPAHEAPPWNTALPPTPGRERAPARAAPAVDEVNPYFPMMPVEDAPGSPMSVVAEPSSGSPPPVGFARPPPFVAPVPVLSSSSEGSMSTAFSSPMTPPDSIHSAVHVVGKDEADEADEADAEVFAMDAEDEDEDASEAELTEEERAALEQQAAVGRLCSMSLIAAVAAGAPLREDTKVAFTDEVERSGRDAVYWVRREAAFAIGALAKVLPAEVVHVTLLPLLRALCKDEAWHVRHASLFAVPPVLGCLPAADRHTVSLELLLPLAADSTQQVRRGLLEALGEVIHCFHGDAGGPPDELLRLFLGRDTDRRWWEDWLCARGLRPAQPTRAPSPAELAAQAGGSVQEMLRLAAQAERDANPPNFFDEPARALVRAFNFPALALTLGAGRWGELRGTYVELAQSADAKVRRTLAASTGELARIVGPAHAARDVLGVWRGALAHAEADVRLKAIEALEALLGAVDARERVGLVRALDAAWGAGLRGWREREAVARTLCAFVGLLGSQADLLAPLVRKALEDDVAAVREVAVAATVPLFDALAGRADVRRAILDDIARLAAHPSFRKRMTYVACQQALVHGADGALLVTDPGFWRALRALAGDGIADVRIGVARLVGIICDRFYRESASIPGDVLDLVVALAGDASADVRAFVSVEWRARPPLPPPPAAGEVGPTFSRPPPPGLAGTPGLA